MDDVRAVMDAVGSERAALFGHSEGGNMCVLFAATYPSGRSRSARSASTRGGSGARTTRGRRRRRSARERSRRSSGPGRPGSTRRRSPRASTRRGWRRSARYLRRSASPGAGVALLKMNTQIDVRDVLPDDPGADARDAPDRRPRRERRGGALDRGADSRCPLRRVPGRRSHLVDAGLRPGRGRAPGVPHRRASRPRAGSRPGDRPLHRHRRLDRAGGRARRPPLDGAPRAPSRGRAAGARAVPRPRGRHRRRRLPRHLRRAGARDPLRRAVRDGVRDLGPRAAGRAPHRRVRAPRRQGDRHRRSHRGRVSRRRRARARCSSRATVHDLVSGSGIRFEDRGERELKGVGRRRIYAVVDA